MSMTLEQMEAIATDLDKRVGALEKRKLPASFAPQNTFVTNVKNETIDTAGTNQLGGGEHSTNQGFILTVPALGSKAKVNFNIGEISVSVADGGQVAFVSAYFMGKKNWNGAEPLKLRVTVDGQTVKGPRLGTTNTVLESGLWEGKEREIFGWTATGTHNEENRWGFEQIEEAEAFPTLGAPMGAGAPIPILLSEGEHILRFEGELFESGNNEHREFVCFNHYFAVHM